MKRAAIAFLFAALAAAPAHAGGMNLSWDDCGVAGTELRTFSCNTNAGSNKLVISVQPEADIADAVGWEAAIRLQANETTLNPWWQMFNVGSCRGSAVPTLDTSFGTTCTNATDGISGFGVIGSYTVGGNNATLVCGWATATPFALLATNEYYTINLDIDNTRTIGTSSCSGCGVGVGIALYTVLIAYGPDGALTQTINVRKDREYVCWQCPCGFYSEGYVGFNCPATPTLTRTWGAIKTLYR
jgi:hypothetical protein